MERRETLPNFQLNLVLSFLALLVLAVSGGAQTNTEESSIISTLKTGNERFISGKLQPKDFVSERPKLVKEQHPYAIVLACADSRVPPEIVFDESLGKLFVVRTAGHVVDPVALGSIEYAVEHLHVHMLFVLGHEGCGAVKATLGGGEASANIKSLLHRIRPAVNKTMAAGLPEKDQLRAAVTENVRYQMQMAVYESEVLADFVQKKKLAIAGGVYSLATGRVDLLSTRLVVDRGTDPRQEREHPADEHATHPTENSHPAAASRKSTREHNPAAEDKNNSAEDDTYHEGENSHKPAEKSHRSGEKKKNTEEKSPRGSGKKQSAVVVSPRAVKSFNAGEEFHNDPTALEAAQKDIREMKWQITFIDSRGKN